MKTVNGKPVSNAEYKRNQAAYHNVEYDYIKMRDEALKRKEEEDRKHPYVLGTSKQWVEVLDQPSVVISIGDPGEATPNYACKHKDILRIEVDDIDQPMSKEYTLFDYIHGRKILDFLKRHQGTPIVVHCHAGISRSAAVVKFMIEELGYRLDDRESCTVKGFASYNHWIYRPLKICHVDSIMQ